MVRGFPVVIRMEYSLSLAASGDRKQVQRNRRVLTEVRQWDDIWQSIVQGAPHTGDYRGAETRAID